MDRSLSIAVKSLRLMVWIRWIPRLRCLLLSAVDDGTWLDRQLGIYAPTHWRIQYRISCPNDWRNAKCMSLGWLCSVQWDQCSCVDFHAAVMMVFS